MPAFETPGPISVTISLGTGDLRITAREATETVVDVRPADETSSEDVRAAEQTRVEYADGSLLVKAPKGWKRYRPFSDGGSVDVAIELPVGSRVDGEAAMAAVRCAGRLGDCAIKTSAGDISLGQAGTVHLSTAADDITADLVAGGAEVTTASGDVRIGAVGGTAVIKNSNGDTRVGEASGEVRIVGANGDISIGRTGAATTAKTANGTIRVGEVVRGSATLQTAFGTSRPGSVRAPPPSSTSAPTTATCATRWMAPAARNRPTRRPGSTPAPEWATSSSAAPDPAPAAARPYLLRGMVP